VSIFKGQVVRNEPALILGLVQAVIALVLAFGIDLSEEQIGSILALTAVVLAIVTRMLVTPSDTTTAPSPPPPGG
jgi:predicted ABC-type sugar transport system permease subunit